MDGKRIKTILIVALLLTDIFLLGIFFLRETPDYTREVDEGSILTLLESRSITIDIDMPHQHPDMATLNVKKFTIDDESFARISELEIADYENATEATYKNATDKLLEELGFSAAGITLKTAQAGENTAIVEYICVINEITVEDCYINCTFVDGKIINFVYSWLTPNELSKYKREIISAGAALLKLAAEVEEPLRITDMQLVYYVDNTEYSEAATDTAFPAWRIETANEDIYYVLAYE